MAKTIDPRTAWEPYSPGPANPWDLKKVGHVYRRAAFGSSWAVMLNSIDGARSVDPLLIDTGKVNRLGTFAILRRIVLPASLPQISAGMRTALGIALILMVFSEMIGADSGLGFQILTSQRRFLVPETYGGVLLIGLIGWAFTVVFAFTERRVLAWHHGRTGGGAGG